MCSVLVLVLDQFFGVLAKPQSHIKNMQDPDPDPKQKNRTLYISNQNQVENINMASKPSSANMVPELSSVHIYTVTEPSAVNKYGARTTLSREMNYEVGGTFANNFTVYCI